MACCRYANAKLADCALFPGHLLAAASHCAHNCSLLGITEAMLLHMVWHIIGPGA
jgi:hypothetical protein